MLSSTRLALTVVLAVVALMLLGAQPCSAQAECFVGQIIMVGFNYSTPGFVLCEGQELQIAQNQALYAVIGTRYGGNGQTTFKLPDLRGATIQVGGQPAPVPVSSDKATIQVGGNPALVPVLKPDVGPAMVPLGARQVPVYYLICVQGLFPAHD